MQNDRTAGCDGVHASTRLVRSVRPLPLDDADDNGHSSGILA